VFILCVVLCAVFRLIVVIFCVLCLIVVPLPPGENPFAVKININNNNNNNNLHLSVDLLSLTNSVELYLGNRLL
jgi:hypothetical protein